MYIFVLNVIENYNYSSFYFPFQDVSGQVVLITGGGGGVGRLIALNFAKLNARVVIWDINHEGNRKTNAAK